MGWTDQQIQTLKKMWGNGYSASDIAKSLGGGMTRNAVIGKAHRLKLSIGASAGGSRQMPDAPSKTPGVVMTTITKISKRKTMLRVGVPPVSQPRAGSIDSFARVMNREPIKRPIELAKRTEGVPVTKVGERHCRWPIGDPRSPDFRFCGCEAHEGLPYCLEHARIAYQTVSRKARANANADNVADAFQAPEKAKKA